MADDETLEAARTGLGRIGALLPVCSPVPSLDVQRRAVGALDRAGYGAVWVNEVVGGKDALVQLALLASASNRMSFGTCIANVWARPAPTLHAAAAQLAEALPGRFVLGIGVGVAAQAAAVERDFGRPVPTMRRYLAQMAAPGEPPASGRPYPRLVAANGPKLLELAAASADGALPAGVSPEFTAHARAVLGPDLLLVVLVPGSDVDEAPTVRRHLDAGADHVIVSVPRGSEFAAGVERLVGLAAQLPSTPAA